MESLINLVYLIDDDEIYKYATRKIIVRTNLVKNVMEFEDGEEAITFLNRNCKDCKKVPDVIFLDINMPYLDGWGFLNEFAKLKDNIKKEVMIFMLSTSSLQQDIEKANSYSEVTGYIVKPITEDQFRNLISRFAA